MPAQTNHSLCTNINHFIRNYIVSTAPCLTGVFLLAFFLPCLVCYYCQQGTLNLWKGLAFAFGKDSALLSPYVLLLLCPLAISKVKLSQWLPLIEKIINQNFESPSLPLTSRSLQLIDWKRASDHTCFDGLMCMLLLYLSHVCAHVYTCITRM